MDIVKLQKVNSLAKELRHHGIAEDMLDAAIIADGMINKKQEVKEIYDSVTLQNAKKISEQYTDVNASIRQLTNLVNSQTKTIEELNKKMEQLKFQFDIVKKQGMARQEGISIRPAENVPQAAVQNNSGITELAPTPRGSPTQRQEPHAKIGMYGPADVAVEKMFYSGPK